MTPMKAPPSLARPGCVASASRSLRRPWALQPVSIVCEHVREQEAYRLAFLGSATRVIPDPEFTAAEGIAAFLPVLE